MKKTVYLNVLLIHFWRKIKMSHSTWSILLFWFSILIYFHHFNFGNEIAISSLTTSLNVANFSISYGGFYYKIISVDLILCSLNLSGWGNSISVTSKSTISQTQLQRTSSFNLFFRMTRSSKLLLSNLWFYILFNLPNKICLWRRWQRSEVTPEPEWLECTSWRPD